MTTNDPTNEASSLASQKCSIGEPVQKPGCDQAHRALLVQRPADLTVLRASENSESLLGHPPEALVGHSVAAVLSPNGEAQLRTFLEAEPTGCNPLCVLTLLDRGVVPALDVTVHSIDGVSVVEFEATGRMDKLIPVVVFSTSADSRDLAFCYGAGADAYHVKPVRYPDHLQLAIDIITYWLGRVALPNPRGISP